MRALYPEITPGYARTIPADHGHRIYVEECGNPGGLPVVFIHGGPGSGCNENHRRYFNPGKYRIIIFDQRGCNRSSPAGSIEYNTTQALIADMEMIREHFAIKRWLLFAGSWGATLALMYAIQYGQRCLGLILRGTFLARRQDLDWFARDGASRIFPDYWAEFVAASGEQEPDDLVAAYYRRLHGDDSDARQAAARAWARWAGRLVTYLLPSTEAGEAAEDIARLVNEVGIETHYAKHHYFIGENEILRRAGSLPQVPTWIIHGRRDLTCTLDASWELHRAVAHSRLTIVDEAGHLAGEPAMTDALISATDAMVKRLA